jgi:spore maturation protein CgeB
MRILILDTCYPAFLASHYSASHRLEEESYAVQWRALMGTFFGTADSYSHFLGELGHEAHEVVVNCAPMQAAWAREHGLARRGLRRVFGSLPGASDIVRHQIAWFRPDVIYVQNLSVFPPALLAEFRGNGLLVGQIASELPRPPQLEPFDLILTSFPHYVPRLRAQGHRSEYLRIGFDPRALEAVGNVERDLDVAFVGSLGRGQHSAGNVAVAQAAGRIPLSVWGPGIDEWPPDSSIRKAYKGEAWGINMLRVFARSRIVLNRHIDVAEDYANNMRLFEATGMGALLLTDDKRNLSDLFTPGVEVVTYGDAEELVRQVDEYLGNDTAAELVAKAGQRRTLGEHSYSHRMRELVSILERYAS